MCIFFWFVYTYLRFAVCTLVFFSRCVQVLFGTPEFVAPEVVNFDRISFGTDMWSVGVICYVLYVGQTYIIKNIHLHSTCHWCACVCLFADDIVVDCSFLTFHALGHRYILTRLSGLSPFMGSTDIETMTNVTIGKYDFDDEAFSKVSKHALDFISKLLAKDLRWVTCVGW